MNTQKIILSKINKTLKEEYVYIELSFPTFIMNPIVQTGRKDFYVFCKLNRVERLLNIARHLRVDLNTMMIEDMKGNKLDYIFPLVLPVDEKYNMKMSTVRKRLKDTYLKEFIES